MNFSQARFNMIQQQVRPWNVLDEGILALLEQVPRELFVPTAYKNMAYADLEIPQAGNTASLSPKVQARLLQDAAVQPHDRILQIGAGTGYLTALLAKLGQSVVAYEIDTELAKQAASNLQDLGIKNVEIHAENGATGANDNARFDVIVLSGAVAEMPTHLAHQLKDGGRMVGIVGQEPVMQGFLLRKVADQQFSSQFLWDILAPALQGFSNPNPFHF